MKPSYKKEGPAPYFLRSGPSLVPYEVKITVVVNLLQPVLFRIRGIRF